MARRHALVVKKWLTKRGREFESILAPDTRWNQIKTSYYIKEKKRNKDSQMEHPK